MIKQFNFIYKVIAMYLIINMIGAIAFPTVIYALTSGPSSPDFSSFTPVSANDMVNTFTGDFTYNLPLVEVPGPQGSGYSLGLTYNSGVSSEQEASWVGFGWSLNPGSITRNLRGIPDDYSGEEIKYYYKSRPTWTATSGLNTNFEVFSKDELKIGGLGADFIHRLNNHTGYQKVTSLGLNVAGMVGVNATFDPNGVTYAPYISPAAIANKKYRQMPRSTKESNREAMKTTSVLDGLGKQLARTSMQTGNISASFFNVRTVQDVQKPFQMPTYTGLSMNWSASLQGNFAGPVPIGVQVGKSGQFDFRYNKYNINKAAYGYLNTKTIGVEEELTDYFVEKARPFNRQDVILGIPHSNHDIFSVTGEGVIGGFRAYPYNIGHFAPEKNESKTDMANVGFEAMVGTNVGAGIDIGYGYNKTKTSRWGDKNADDGGMFFRFNNDLGGEVNYKYRSTPEEPFADATDVDKANIWTIGNFIDKTGGYQAGEYSTGNEQTEPNKRSSFIEPKYNNGKIMGFSVINENGVLYNYHQPIRVRNETMLSVDVTASKDEINRRFLAFKPLALSKVNGQYHVTKAKLHSSFHKCLQGEINTNTYIKSYLLTEILTPSYIDIDESGDISNGDFGGWTAFDYRKAYGDNSLNESNAWYRFRSPYNGLAYQQGSISDPKDDVGSITTGEKEVLYLKAIRTKTHVACFVTNKTKQSDFAELLNNKTISALDGSYVKESHADNKRKDGLGALNLTNEKDPASEKLIDEKRHNQNADLEFLEKIVLYSIDQDGHINTNSPLKMVHFEYDYSLVPNVVNNVNSSYNYGEYNNALNDESGKLTLRKVWTEYQGIVSAKISPYVFNYHYPTPDNDKLISYFSEYADLTDDDQNPMYSPYSLGPWGNIMPDGEERRKNGVPWIKQAALLEDQTIDPAAYHLKSIQLPSGSKIYVQYESDDYAYVQDRNAMSMAHIIDSEIDDVHGFGSDFKPKYDETPVYYIAVKDLGVDDTKVGQVDALVSKIDKHFEKDENGEYGKKLYYKFLFSLIGKNKATLDNFKSDYITGYADIKSVERWPLENNADSYSIKITLDGVSDNDRSLVPQQACYEFVSNQRQGKVHNVDGVEGMERKYDNRLSATADEGKAGLGIGLEILAGMALGINFTKYGNLSKKEVAQSFNEDLSFLKLPTLHRKIGGGVRVKRIILHDAGIEEGDEMIIGTNYFYTLDDGVTSSGVATNEPNSAREENPLVDFMPMRGQDWFKKMINGENKEQTEGPIGESLLPGASIGYSRVVVENIHTGKTGNGYSIYEYYTSKDYPYDKYYDHMNENDYDFASGVGADKTKISQEDVKVGINAGLFAYNVDRVWMSQGYRFIQNNMHGQIKKSSTFSGQYAEKDKSYLASYQAYEYFEPGEKVELLKLDANSNTLSTNTKVPGKEMNITREARKIVDKNYDLNVEIDLSAGIMFFPPIFVGVIPTFKYRENAIATHVTNKVINYPSILKSQTSYIDGISSTTEFVAFNESTGRPVLTRNTDSYEGTVLNTKGDDGSYDSKIYSLSIPAEWIPKYSSMGQKAVNTNNSNELSALAATYTIYNKKPDTNWWQNPVNIINASIQTYGKDYNWAHPALLVTENQTQAWVDEKQTCLNKSWRPKGAYTYNANIDNGNKVYDKGYFDIGMNTFDYNNAPINEDSNNTNWLENSNVVLYSYDGEVLEEKDALGIKSAVVYGKQYGNSVPVMVANNADFGSILFRDFESDEIAQYIDNPHSGKRAALISNVSNVLEGLIVTQELVKQGGLFKAWLKTNVNDPKLVINGISESINLSKISQVGEWSLFEGKLPQSDDLLMLNSTLETLQATLISETGFDANDMIDDIRFQPLRSKSSCFVYDDEDLKLLTQFDDQHFGLYYQYNMEGQLVRKIVETERGKFTIQEVNYNIPKLLRVSNE